MKNSHFWAIGILVLGQCARAEDQAPFVNQTFQEIQKRVVQRDPVSHAIGAVKNKDDAPTIGYGLDFSLKKLPQEGEVELKLSIHTMQGDIVWEQYRLKMDDALRQELQNQELSKKLQAEAAVREEAAAKKRILELSNNTLHYGMTLAEVTNVKSEPQKTEIWQAAGSFSVSYRDMFLTFHQGRLCDAVKPPKPAP